ncbi:MAG: hypothetical protein VYA69_06975 [Gemmatimonadota bacterium]|nr:hypothetical protein [Gemmatimonadota bacterium]
MGKVFEHDDEPPNKNTSAAYGKADSRYGISRSGTSFSYYGKKLPMRTVNHIVGFLKDMKN